MCVQQLFLSTSIEDCHARAYDDINQSINQTIFRVA